MLTQTKLVARPLVVLMPPPMLYYDPMALLELAKPKGTDSMGADLPGAGDANGSRDSTTMDSIGWEEPARLVKV